MPIDHDDLGVGYRPMEGLYEALLAEDRERVIQPDPRLLNWDLINPDEIASDNAALEAEAKAHPRHSELLDKMTLGEAVVIPRAFLDGWLSPDAPEWMRDPRLTQYVRLYPDDVIEPADGPPCA
jgi:hypothetical protein